MNDETYYTASITETTQSTVVGYVRTETQNILDAIEGAQKAVSVLGEKMAPIRRPVPDSEDTRSADPAPSRSMLAEQLANAHASIRLLIDQINGLTAEVDV